MGIGRRPTDDKIEVLASAKKIPRVVLSKILKLFDFISLLVKDTMEPHVAEW